MVMEEEAKLVPKNGSDCESNGASSAAANGNYDLCGRTPTSEVTLTRDEISPASLIKHDDRSESILIGLRNWFLERLHRLLFSVLVGGAFILLDRDIFKFSNRQCVDAIAFCMLLLAVLLVHFSPTEDLNRDGEIKQTEDISPIEEGLFSDEYVNTEFVNQVHDSAADSISDTTHFSPWERGDCIGSGAYGIVYVHRNRITGGLRAVKELNIEDAEDAKSFRKEIKIFSQLEHPNIVKYYGHEEDGHKISVYMEFIESGSLKKYLKRGALHETLIRNFTAQILSGLVYLHSKRVVHRDLKPENILVDSQDIVKLVDFGESKHVLNKKIEYKSLCEASAPDIWSLGCVVIEMFTGKHPWPDYEPQQAGWNVVGKGQCPSIPDELCSEGKDFLERCFIRTPADRPSATELQDHPFVKPQNSSC